MAKSPSKTPIRAHPDFPFHESILRRHHDQYGNVLEWFRLDKGVMKKRYLYALLFGIPGLFISGIVSVFIFGALLGMLWIFVFGDNPWPVQIETVTSILFVLVFLMAWIGSMALGYKVGMGLEKDPVVNRNHVLASAGLTVLFILIIILQQWSVGNLGPTSDSVICSDFCVQKGYSGSGMPPQDSGDITCSCFDDSGNEVLKIPLDEIDLDANK